MPFLLAQIVLLMWAVASLLYAIIKRDERYGPAFLILAAMLFIAVSNAFNSENIIYSFIF